MFGRGVTLGDLNYAAACYPLNAARRSLNPRDGSLWRDGVRILVVTRSDLPYAKTFAKESSASWPPWLTFPLPASRFPNYKCRPRAPSSHAI